MHVLLYISCLILGFSAVFRAPENPTAGNSGRNETGAGNQHMSFNATIVNNHVVLSWKTISANNFMYFLIEKSLNGSSFTEISKISATGTNNKSNEYTATDNKIPDNTAYYRLAHIDTEGKVQYSDLLVISGIKNPSSGCRVNIEPNPCLGKCSVKFNNCSASSFDFDMFDFLGNSVVASLTNKQVPAGLEFDTENYLKPGLFISKANRQ